MKTFFGMLLYFAFGFVFMVLFHSPVFLPMDAWAWAWLIGWPVLIALFILKWLAVIFILLVLVSTFFVLREERW